MLLNTKKLTLVSILLIGMSLSSYILFIKYQPKVLKKVEEVKGLSSTNTDGIPYPVDAVKIGFNQTPKSKQTTFKTSKTEIQVQEFYRNIFNDKKWKIITDKTEDHTSIVKYQKEDETVTTVTIVATSEEAGYTTVSVELTTL